MRDGCINSKVARRKRQHSNSQRTSQRNLYWHRYRCSDVNDGSFDYWADRVTVGVSRSKKMARHDWWEPDSITEDIGNRVGVMVFVIRAVMCLGAVVSVIGLAWVCSNW